MIVAELIAKLAELEQDALVLVDGFDSTDFDYAADPEIVRVVPVKQTSHGPSFVEPVDYNLRHREATGAEISAVYIGIGDAS